MHITIENLPIIFLIMVGIGMAIVLIGIIRLAGHQESGASVYTSLNEGKENASLEDLFSFFLQEEEKKNQSFREMVMDVTNKSKLGHKDQVTPTVQEKINKTTSVTKKEKTQVENEVFAEIMRRYEAGEDVETIAKELKKGTGEVKLIISLYSMR